MPTSALPLKAVILAAGRGNRIAEASRGTPKPLLPLDGEAEGPTFLDWHIDALMAHGATAIYVVGNQATYGTRTAAMAGRPVHWILNPTDDLSASGSAHSAQYAWRDAANILDGASRVVLMDADLLYDPVIFERLLSSNEPRSKVLVHPEFRHTHEEVLVYGTPGAPTQLGKGLPGSPMVEGLTCLGEATGILLWEPHDHAALAAATDWAIGYSTAKARSEHEDVTQLMMRMQRVAEVACRPDDAFMEVDTPEEYATMRTVMYPRLRAGVGT